jgi:hypothetical protein
MLPVYSGWDIIYGKAVFSESLIKACYENKVLWYLLTVLTYQSHVTSLRQHSS